MKDLARQYSGGAVNVPQIGHRGHGKRWMVAGWLAWLLLGFAVPLHAGATTADSVSQHGVTWIFDNEQRVGQYVNGDWWVEGPVTITEIHPASTIGDNNRVMHGSMLNPVGGSQGFDSHNSDMSYDAELNVDPGATGEDLVLTKGSVVSAISKESPRANGRPVLDDLAVLTVVEGVPAHDAFRPGPFTEGTAARWTERDLNYGVLRSLPMLDSAPDLGEVTESVERFWNHQNTNWTQRAVHASNNQSVYGREIAYTFGEALLSLHLDHPHDVKQDLFIHMVQRGLDIYDRAKAGGVWEDLGGHNHGRKMPMLFAGLALEDEDIKTMADAEEHLIFQEDRQTFIVSEDDVGKELRTDDRDRETYREEDVGMPEWGEQHTRNGRRDDRRWGAQYRWVGSGFMYHALAAYVMDGAVDAWNHPPFFQYLDRYVELGSPSTNSTNTIQPFAQEFWDEYREVGPNEGTTSPPRRPKFSHQ